MRQEIWDVSLSLLLITADTALRFARYFGLSERFWLNLQSRYDLEVEKDKLDFQLEKEVRILEAKQLENFRNLSANN